MKRQRQYLIALLGFAAALAPNLVPGAQAQDHWVATWASAQQQPRVAGAGRGPVAPPAAPPNAGAASGAASTPSVTPPAPAATAAPRPLPPPSSFNNQTVRMVVRTSIGGTRLRV